MLKKAFVSLSFGLALFASFSFAEGTHADSLEAKKIETTIVYKAKVGSRYHNKDCKYLKKGGTQITVIQAMKEGLAPCNVCHPPKLKRS